MKILYLEGPEADFGTSQLYMGLVQLLGDENIIEYPYKYCAHQLFVDDLPFPRIDVDLYVKDNPGTDVRRVFPPVHPYQWIFPSKNREYRYQEIVNMIGGGEFNLILLPPRNTSVHNLGKLIQDCAGKMPPVILCDFEDSTDVRYDLYRRFYPYIKLLTKSIYLPDMLGSFRDHRIGDEKVYPLSMASPICDNPRYQFDDSNENKTIEIFARFGLTRDQRKDVFNSIKDIKGFCGHAESYYVPYDQYCKEIASSKIGVSMRGYGLYGNPNRHWEIPSYNTLMLCEATNTIYENPFEDSKTCIFFDANKKDDAYEKAIYWLKDENENERRRIAKAGNDLVKKYHTCKMRANRLIDIAKTERLI